MPVGRGMMVAMQPGLAAEPSPAPEVIDPRRQTISRACSRICTAAEGRALATTIIELTQLELVEIELYTSEDDEAWNRLKDVLWATARVRLQLEEHAIDEASRTELCNILYAMSASDVVEATNSARTRVRIMQAIIEGLISRADCQPKKVAGRPILAVVSGTFLLLAGAAMVVTSVGRT